MKKTSGKVKSASVLSARKSVGEFLLSFLYLIRHSTTWYHCSSSSSDNRKKWTDKSQEENTNQKLFFVVVKLNQLLVKGKCKILRTA